MPPLKATSSTSKPYATYTIHAQDAIEVLSHRKLAGIEQYLVRWKPEAAFPAPSDAACSWHALPELYRCLHLVQTYIEDRRSTLSFSNVVDSTFTLESNRKRKSPDADPLGARDLQHGLLTPRTNLSRSPSVGDTKTTDELEPDVYNTVLYRKEGFIIAKKPDDWRSRTDIAKVDCRTLPTDHMQAVAARTSISQADSAIRHKFLQMLRPVKGVQLENLIDTTTPSLDFTFINQYVLRNGIYAQPPEIYEGCVKKCRPDMGQHIGCEYTALCECLEYAAVDEDRMKTKDPELYQRYKQADLAGEQFDTLGLPKRFPYRSSKNDPTKPQTLQPFYLNERYAIYECNDNCRCGPVCKSRVVQKGRRVPLTIFKTQNRGWGVYCSEDLIQGEFIDTYLGEVITDEEAKKREADVGHAKESYLYSLDKWVDEPYEGGILTEDMCYIVDGQYMGNATRFINHSCEPNCRQFTVSYNKNDNRLYNLAFFASENIPSGVELTFDYQDEDELEEDKAIEKRKQAESDPKNADRIRCNCGAPKCRGFLW